MQIIINDYKRADIRVGTLISTDFSLGAKKQHLGFRLI
jgi:hypothetical protein